MRPIDADALKIHVCDMCDDGQRECKGDESCAILCWINDMPTLETEPVCYAVWVNETFCSNCKRFPVDVSVPISNQELTKHFSRCPHCGAKMKKEG